MNAFEKMARNTILKLAQSIQVIILSIIDLLIAYFCCYFSIGAEEHVKQIFVENPIHIISIKFVFSLLVTYVVSILCVIVLQFIIYSIVYFVHEIIGCDYHYAIIKKQIFIRVLKFNMLIVILATIFWLCYKYFSLGYL